MVVLTEHPLSPSSLPLSYGERNPAMLNNICPYLQVKGKGQQGKRTRREHEGSVTIQSRPWVRTQFLSENST